MGHQAGKEIMLHAPMSTLSDQYLGTGALTLDLSEAEFRATLNAAILQIPHLQGVNNHMGSELTQHPQQMVWLMDELKQQGLYFVDSRTSKETVAARIAEEQRVAQVLPGLAEQGIALTSVSEVLNQHSQGNSPAGVITDSPAPEGEALTEEIKEAQSLTSIPRAAM